MSLFVIAGHLLKLKYCVLLAILFNINNFSHAFVKSNSAFYFLNLELTSLLIQLLFLYICLLLLTILKCYVQSGLGLSTFCQELVGVFFLVCSFKVAFPLERLVLYLDFLEQCCRSFLLTGVYIPIRYILCYCTVFFFKIIITSVILSPVEGRIFVSFYNTF